MEFSKDLSLMASPTVIQGVLWTVAALFVIAAAQDEQREVPIIKQINRVNDDGTYTFGYEAADGSFKIETRDVLGNVKGMFGYIDDRGQLKRVSYTANNGTGFQATGNIPGITDAGVTRRPVLVYKGLNNRPVTERSEDDDGPTRPSYGDYLHSRKGYITTTTEEPTTRPLRVLVTKRPVEGKSPNVIRRQLDRDRDDYSSRRFRYQQPQGPDPREVYRNLLLEQSNLKPDYPSRTRYYTPVDEDYPEMATERVTVAPRYAPPAPRYPPVPRAYDDQQYPIPDRRFPFRASRPYDDYPPPPPPDYEAFRAAMNYLLQYLQYMRRMDPYTQPYSYPQDQFPPRPRLPPFYPPPRFPPIPPPGLPLPVPSPFPPSNIPYINPNVQYSTGRENAQEALANLKTRMDHSDQTDSGDTRPPTASLIRMLLSRPTQRPAIRSVEVLGTSKSTTSTTTERSDVMETSS